MFGQSRLVAAATAAALMTACPARADATRALALLPIKLLDTSGEPRDQDADHRRRLEDMQRALAESLSSAYRVSTVSMPALDAACPNADGPCILALGRASGADVALIAVVHKSSSLIMQLFAKVVDLRGDTVVASRELNFRGDNDESWRRAEVFLAGQLLEAKAR